jgi:peroxiredoxin
MALMLMAFGPAADPLTLSGPQLARGDELVYTGEVQETGDRFDNRYKKRYEVEVRVFVLDATAGYSDCGVMTTVQPLDDTLIPEVTLPGQARVKANPSVRLDLIRVDDRGRVRALAPTVGPPPLPIGKHTPTTDPVPMPLDAPPGCELAAFVPLPIGAAKTGGTWDTTESNRPPLVWTAGSEAIWNGRRCVELTATQRTDGYELPDTVRHGWKRTETVLVSPADGYASRVTRSIVRREGRDQVGTLTARYELQPANKYAGEKYRETRAEIEAAWAFSAEHATTMAASRPRPGELRARAAAVDRYLGDRTTSTPYRMAIEAVKRRYDGGTAPPVAKKIVANLVEQEELSVGQPAPDFAAIDVSRPTGRIRLSAVRGKPAVLVFYKPGSATAVEALSVCEALHRKYADTLTVIPLAIHTSTADAEAERAKLKMTAPVYSGDDVRQAYSVSSYPHFFMVNRRGLLHWTFDAGVGPEVGYLVKQEVEKLLK